MLLCIETWCRLVSLERAGHPAILKGQRGEHKEKVEEEHGDAQHLGHLPAGQQDAEEHEAQHREQHDNGAAQALAGHLDRHHEHAGVEEPGQGQPSGAQRGEGGYRGLQGAPAAFCTVYTNIAGHREQNGEEYSNKLHIHLSVFLVTSQQVDDHVVMNDDF